MLISRQEVIEFYSSRASQIGWDLPCTVIERLPPALLHRILMCRPSKTDDHGGGFSRLTVGFDDPNLETWKNVALSVRGFSDDIQSVLPLEGHKPIGAPGILRWIRLALDELEAFDPGSVSFIQDWVSVVVWVERTGEHPDITELTSTSLPILPFATFVSKKMIRHIPPKHILPAVNFYGIQENIFHEALHQQLASFLIVRDALVRHPAQCPMIHIPWRRSDWPIDRVLHAAWVYANIQDFRRRRLSKFYDCDLFMRALSQSLEDAELSLTYLARELNQSRSAFSESGKAIIDWVSSKSHTSRFSTA